MRPLIIALALALLVTLGLIGIWASRRIANRFKVHRDLAKAQRSLAEHKRFIEQLRARAADHQALGDPFATIATDEIQAFSPAPNTLAEGTR